MNAHEHIKIAVYQIVTIKSLVKTTFVIHGARVLPGGLNTTQTRLKTLQIQSPAPILAQVSGVLPGSVVELL